MFTRACKQITEQLPFHDALITLTKQKDVLYYLMIGQPLFHLTIDLIITAMIDKFCNQIQFVSYFFQSAQQVACLNDNTYVQGINSNDYDPNQTSSTRYCSDLYANLSNMKYQLLVYTKQFAILLKKHYYNQQNVGETLLHFYKLFIQANTKYDMLNKCFKDALEMREQWPELVNWEPYFESQIEEILIQKNFSGQHQQIQVEEIDDGQKEDAEKLNLMNLVSSKAHKQKLNDSMEDIFTSKLSKQERIVKSLEDWLFCGSDIPLISMQSTSQTLHADFFKIPSNIETFLSFLFNPMKNPPIAQQLPGNVDFGAQYLGQDHVPAFKQKWPKQEEIYFMDLEERKIIQYRAFKTMLSLTHSKNHFLITQANGEYFSKCFSIIYESLRAGSSALILSANCVIGYLQFLLYYESDITVYFLLYYNLPFRLLLYMEYPSVASFLVQLLLQQTNSRWYLLENSLTQMIWKYMDVTEFFLDLQKLTLGDENGAVADVILHYKSMVSFKPKNLNSDIVKPDLTPLQQEKAQFNIELKKVPEEYDLSLGDQDRVKPFLRRRAFRMAKLLEQMIESSPKFKRKAERSETVKVSFFAADRNTPRRTTTFISIDPPITPTTYTKIPSMSAISAIEVKTTSPHKGPNIFQIIESALQDHEKSPARNRKASQEDIPQRHGQRIPSFGGNDKKTHEKQFKINNHKRMSSLHIDTQLIGLDQNKNKQPAAPVGEQKKIVPISSDKRIQSRGSTFTLSTKQGNNMRNLIFSAKQPAITSLFSSNVTQNTLEIGQQEPASMLRRFQNLLVDKRPNTSLSGVNRKTAALSEHIIRQREQCLYPSTLRDFHLTKLEERSKLPIFEGEILEKNEAYTRELIGLTLQIVEDLCQRRGKGRYELEQRRMKWQILTTQKEPEFIDWLAQNYFLKLKIQDDADFTTAMTSGKIYNRILQQRKNVVFNLKISELEGVLFQHFKLLIQLLTSIYILEPLEEQTLQLQNLQIASRLRIKTYTLFETLTLLLESTNQPSRYIVNISTSLWHLMLIYLVEYRTNDLYIQLIDRVMEVCILNGNTIFFHNIILRLNCYQFFCQFINEMQSTLAKGLWSDLLPIALRKIFLLMFTVLKLKSNEFSQLKSQVELLVSFQTLKSNYKQDVTLIEKDDFKVIEDMVLEDSQKTLQRAILQYNQQKTKRR